MNFYDSIIEGAQELPAAERGQLYTAVLEYLYYGREPDFAMRPAPRAIFMSMRPVFENQRAKQEAGRKGGKAQARAKQTPSKAEAEAKQTPKQTPSRAEADTQAEAKQGASKGPSESQANRNSNSNRRNTSPDGEVKKSAPRFVPPTPEEVSEYATAKGYDVDAEAFCAYYGSQGWRKANGQRVTNWKLAVVNWARQNRRYGTKRPKITDFSAYEIVDEGGA